jgi:hypothetical protein
LLEQAERTSFHNSLALPLALLPRARAYKRIEAGRYRFEVAFVLPVLGTVLSYGGLLDADTAKVSASPSTVLPSSA